MGIKVFAVVVVYERTLAEVEPWPALCAMLAAQGSGGPQLQHVLIYDNSALSRAAPITNPTRISYFHDPGNGGTAAAIGSAAKMASELGLSWLLLVDHDTRLAPDFLARMGEAFRTASALPSVAALLPRVRQRGSGPISPVRVTLAGTFRPLDLTHQPSRDDQISAIASGSILRLDALRSVLPLPRDLWLDYVDHWIFAQLHKRGFTSIVVDQIVDHDLSIRSPRTLSAERLESVLRGEARFHQLLGPLARLVYPGRLAMRLLRLARINPRLALQGAKLALAGLSAEP